MQPHVSNNIFAIALPFPAAFLANKFALLHRTQATKTKLTKIKQTNRRPGQQKKKVYLVYLAKANVWAALEHVFFFCKDSMQKEVWWIYLDIQTSMNK